MEQDTEISQITQDFHSGIGGHEIGILVELQTASLIGHEELQVT